MRLFAAITLALTILALLGAWALADPSWRWSLYLLPLFGTMALAGLSGALLEFMLGAAVRPVAAGLAFAAASFACLHAAFEGAPGMLAPGLPLEHPASSALAIAALGAALAGLFLAWTALRAPQAPARMLAALSLGGCLFALGTTASALGAPAASPYALGLLGAGGALLAASRPPPALREGAGSDQL